MESFYTVGWIIGCLHDVRADCLHYYGIDVFAAWSHDALPLIERLHHYWAVDADVDPPRWRSAVRAWQVARVDEAEQAEVEAGPVIDATAIATFGGEYQQG